MEVRGRKSPSKLNLKATSPEESLLKKKKILQEINNGSLNEKLEWFMKGFGGTYTKIGRTLRKIEKNSNRKAIGLDEISPEVWKTRKFDDILRLHNAVYKQNTIEKWTK